MTLIELLIAIAIVAILLAITLAMVGRSKNSARSVQCLSNLRQIGIAFQLYAGDNKTRLPDPLPLETNWESLIFKYVPQRKVFQCPSDEEAFPTLNSSYDWRDSGDLATSVAGRSISACRSDTIIAFEALPGWHARKKMNAVRLDGSASTLGEQECLAELRSAVVKSENR